ncbi:MAG: flavodoxin family protein [Candidatus Bathyarchaeia archaeon]
MKRAIVIYDTKFGNTEKIAKALARGMREQVVEVDCIRVEEAEIDKLAEYDLLAIGGPTHIRGKSKPMKDFIQKLRRVDLRNKKSFAFDTKFRSWIAGSAAKGIEKDLKRLGMSIVKPYSSAIVKGTEGPLEDGMEEMFKQIGAEIASSI